MCPHVTIRHFNNYQYLANPISSVCPLTPSLSFKDYFNTNSGHHLISPINTLVFILKPLGLLFT